MPFGRTKSLGQLDRLVDHDRARSLEHVRQLEGPQTQNGVFDRVELVHRTIQMGLDGRIEFGGMLLDTTHDAAEQVQIDTQHEGILHELRLELVERNRIHQLLVEPLGGPFTRPAPLLACRRGLATASRGGALGAARVL